MILGKQPLAAKCFELNQGRMWDKSDNSSDCQVILQGSIVTTQNLWAAPAHKGTPFDSEDAKASKKALNDVTEARNSQFTLAIIQTLLASNETTFESIESANLLI